MPTRIVRALGSGFLFVCYGIGGIIFGLLCFPLIAIFLHGKSGRRQMRRLVKLSYRLFAWAAQFLRIIKIDVTDRAALDAIHGKVIVANHLTLIDIVLLMSMLPDTTAVAKGAAADNPFMALVVRRAFLVKRDDPDRLLAEAAEMLRDGVNVVIFPEGTRTPDDGKAHKLQRGAARLALAAGVDVAPIRIDCDPPILGKRQSWHDMGDRVVRYTFAPLADIPVRGESTHSAAVELTACMSSAIFGERSA